MATRIGILSEGALVQIGTPREVYERPANTYVAAHLGTPGINLIPAALLEAPGAPAGTHTIGARTEQLRIGQARNGAVQGVLKRIEHLGDQNHLHLEVRGHSLVTLADPHARWKAGDTLSVELVDPTYFDAAGRRIAA